MTTLRIRVSRDTPVSGAFDWATLDSDGAVLASGTANLRQPPVSGVCEVVLASDLVLLEQADIPAAQRQRVASALRFLVEDSTIADPERQHVVAAPSAGKDRLSLAIVDRQWLEKLLSGLEGAGLLASHAYPESLLPPLRPHTWTVVWNGSDGFARTGELEGFTLDCTETQDAPVALRLALDTARKTGKEPQAIIVRTAADAAPPDTRSWSGALGIPIDSGPPWHWATAQRRPELDLLQGQFASRAAAGTWQQRLRRPAILAGALLLLGSCGIAVDWAAKAYERRVLLAEMSALYRETFGERAVVVDPPLQMSRALADLRRQAGQLGAADFLPLLSAAADRLIDPQRHRIESLAYEKETLTVTLKPNDARHAGTLLSDLRAKSSLQGYEVTVDAAGSSGAVTLRLRAKPGSRT